MFETMNEVSIKIDNMIAATPDDYHVENSTYGFFGR
jgi:hypothetical protein